MEFTKTYRHQELAAVSKLLSVFGVIEERQLRKLFAHLQDREYGRLLSAVRREGFASFTSGGRYITVPNLDPDPERVLDAVLVFWSFYHFRKRIEDFCESDPPALLTFSYEGKDYDLIPGTPANVAAINAQTDRVLPGTTRFIVTGKTGNVPGLELRPVNDYLVAVADDGSCTLLKMKAGEQHGESTLH